MASRHLILIAGMHRSGTSIMTRAINLAGVALPSNLKPASPGVNDDGFWEPLPVKAFHDDLLQQINSRWDDPREIPEQWFRTPLFQGRQQWLRTWIDTEFGDHEMLVVKDPRVCRLMPLWQDTCAAMNVSVHAVIIARNPIEVARSLQKRDQFPEQMSLVIWLRHFLDAERYTRNGSRSFVTFEGLMQDRLGTLHRIASDLGLTFPVPDAELVPLLDEAIKPSLRHHIASDDDLAMAAGVLPVLRTTWEWAQAAANGAAPSPAPLDQITAHMRRMEQAGAQSAAQQ